MDGVIRDDVVSTAVRFLQDPRVAGRSAGDKEAFFKKKGLTDAEIAAAFERAKVTEVLPFPVDAHSNRSLQVAVKSHRSQWAIIRDISSSIIVIVSASYGLKYLYKRYIAPLLYGSNARKSLEESLVESNQAVLRTLTEMATALQSMQETIKVLLERPSTSSTATSAEIREIKAELVSLKGLLLSRKQFSAPPSVGAPILPSWQLEKISEQKTESSKKAKAPSPVPSSPEVVNEEEVKEVKKDSSDSGSSEIMVISAAGSDDEA